MLYRSLIGLVGVAALALASGAVEASKDIKCVRTDNTRFSWPRLTRKEPAEPSSRRQSRTRSSVPMGTLVWTRGRGFATRDKCDLGTGAYNIGPSNNHRRI